MLDDGFSSHNPDVRPLGLMNLMGLLVRLTTSLTLS